MIKIPIMEKKHGGWYYEMPQLGYNCRVTDLQCAMGYHNQKRLIHETKTGNSQKV